MTHAPGDGPGRHPLYNIVRGSAALALDAGVIWSAFEPSVHTDLKLGFKLKMTEGNVFAWFSPNVWIALDDRFDRVVAHEDLVFLPISIWMKPVKPLALGVGTGVKGPVENFGDRQCGEIVDGITFLLPTVGIQPLLVIALLV